MVFLLVVVTVAQLTHHPSVVIKGEHQALLDDLHAQYGVCEQYMVPSMAFASHAGDACNVRVLGAMGTLGVGLLMPSSLYPGTSHGSLACRRSFAGSVRDRTAASVWGQDNT